MRSSASFPFGAITRHALGLVVLTSATFASAAEVEIPLWADGAPGFKHERPEVVEDKRETGRQNRTISYVSIPTLTLYPASSATAATPAVLVVPGGGFQRVCIDKEGIEPARWLNSIGITAAVLKYRVLDPSTERNPATVAPIFADTERAMRVLRDRAVEWRIDPARIGVMGFSAGGVMAIRLVIDHDPGDRTAADPIERVNSRPDFVALVYTGLPAAKLPKADAALPPFFIVHASDDPKTPPTGPIKLYQHLLEAGASAELHIFSEGDHGFGMHPKIGAVRAWPETFARWLVDRGVVEAK